MSNILTSNSHPFLDPLWRRIVLIAFIAAWFLTELYYQSYTWAAIVGLFLVYGAWCYLVSYRPSAEAGPDLGTDAK